MKRLALALLLGGCAAPAVSVRPAAVPPSAHDYGGVYDRWTRVGRVISLTDGDTTLLIAATLRGPEFQQAYAARYVAMYRLEGTPDKARFLDEQKALTDGGVVFIVRTAGHNWRWADLASQKQYWRMALLDEGGAEVLPTKVEPVAVSREPIEAELVGGPLSGPLARFFHVTFPVKREDGQPLLRAGQRLTLRLSGPKGRTDLSWTLKE